MRFRNNDVMLYKVITDNCKNFDYKKKNKCVLSTKKYLTFSRVSEKRAGKKARALGMGS